MESLEKFILSRFFYRIGASGYGISDREYDELVETLRDCDEARPFLDRSYDDDPIPYQLLSKYYTPEEISEMTRYLPDKTNESFKRVNAGDYVSKSIKASFDIQECYSWIKAHRGVELCASLKVDGVNTLTCYRNLSRVENLVTDEASPVPSSKSGRFSSISEAFDRLEVKQTSEFGESKLSRSLDEMVEAGSIDKAMKDAIMESRLGEVDDFVGDESRLKLNEEVNQVVYSPRLDGSVMGQDLNRLVFSRSRGRKGQYLTWTENVSKCLPRVIKNIQPNTEDIFVSAEAYVEPDYLETLGHFAKCSFTTSRDAGRSALQRTDYPDKVYNHVKLLAFRVNVGETLSDGLEALGEIGFPTVPFKKYTFTFNTFEEFEKELSELIWEFKAIATERHIPNDGIVLQVNETASFGKESTETQYDDGNFAVKALGWEPCIYSSIVKEILIKRDYTVRFSVKAIVEPVYTEGHKTLTTVNLFNPKRLIESDVHVGDLIEFEYKNDTTINFIRKLKSGGKSNEQ